MGLSRKPAQADPYLYAAVDDARRMLAMAEETVTYAAQQMGHEQTGPKILLWELACAHRRTCQTRATRMARMAR